VLAVEVKQHKADGVTVLTTQIIGRTSTAQHAKAVTEKREWSSESALDELRRSASAAATVAERLLSWASDRNLPVTWGSGSKVGYAYIVITGRHDSTARPFGLSTDNKFDLYPHQMRRLPPFTKDDVRLEFVRRIGAAAGMPVEDKVIDQSFKSFQLSIFSEPENYKALVAALDWFVEQTGTSHAAPEGGSPAKTSESTNRCCLATPSESARARPRRTCPAAALAGAREGEAGAPQSAQKGARRPRVGSRRGVRAGIVRDRHAWLPLCWSGSLERRETRTRDCPGFAGSGASIRPRVIDAAGRSEATLAVSRCDCRGSRGCLAQAAHRGMSLLPRIPDRVSR
jgi:hypothetical protein